MMKILDLIKLHTFFNECIARHEVVFLDNNHQLVLKITFSLLDNAWTWKYTCQQTWQKRDVFGDQLRYKSITETFNQDLGFPIFIDLGQISEFCLLSTLKITSTYEHTL
jgi:hypothetical protein